jgi:hypothetical protein
MNSVKGKRLGRDLRLQLPILEELEYHTATLQKNRIDRKNMGEGFFNLSRLAWLIGVALLVLIANVAMSIVYMVVYSYVIDPGHDQQYYEAHIQEAAPYCSIIAGIPLMYLAGYWISGWWNGRFAVQSALAVWLAYLLIDFAAIAAAGSASEIGVLFAVSILTKLAAIYTGAVMVGRRRAIAL